jgi:predicted enzyme related to lactoylglutathione lyase
MVLNMPRVVHFEFVAEDIEKVIEFYKTVFGWKIEKWEGPMEYWLITTGDENEPGIDGGLARRTDPSDSTINTIDVENIDEILKAIVTNGGEIIRPKEQLPGVGWLAYIKDPDGNMWGLMKSET